MKKFLLVWALCMCVLCMGISEAEAEDIKIGAILRLSIGASDGLPAKRGIEIAVKEINAAGGIKGKPLIVIYEDSKDSPQASVSAFQKLISMDKVQVVIGPMMSGEVLAVAPIAAARQDRCHHAQRHIAEDLRCGRYSTAAAPGSTSRPRP